MFTPLSTPEPPALERWRLDLVTHRPTLAHSPRLLIYFPHYCAFIDAQSLGFVDVVFPCSCPAFCCNVGNRPPLKRAQGSDPSLCTPLSLVTLGDREQAHVLCIWPSHTCNVMGTKRDDFPPLSPLSSVPPCLQTVRRLYTSRAHLLTIETP